MIELPQRPAARVVAGLALLPKLSGMRIILGVTSNTCLRRALIQLVGMAALAFRNLMPAQQRKCGAIVVDDHLGPAVRDVAARAVPTEFSLMWILFGVTGHALHVELFAMRIVLVAALAGQGAMAAEQRETRRFRMIEADLFP